MEIRARPEGLFILQIIMTGECIWRQSFQHA